MDSDRAVSGDFGCRSDCGICFVFNIIGGILRQLAVAKVIGGIVGLYGVLDGG